MNNVNEASGPSGGSIGNNTVTQHSAETTGYSGKASNSPNINSGGENEEGSTSRHTQHNYEFGESSRANLPRSRIWSRDHPIDQIIGDPGTGVRTRRVTQNECNFAGFLSQMEPKKVDEALEDPDWVITM